MLHKIVIEETFAYDVPTYEDFMVVHPASYAAKSPQKEKAEVINTTVKPWTR